MIETLTEKQKNDLAQVIGGTSQTPVDEILKGNSEEDIKAAEKQIQALKDAKATGKTEIDESELMAAGGISQAAKHVLGFAGGILVGIAGTVGVMYGKNKIKGAAKTQTGTQTDPPLMDESS